MRMVFAYMPAFVLLVAGCSGEGFPETHAVTGVVMHQGNPVEGATVTLVPSDPKGRSASGVTDAEGKFAATSYFSPEHQPKGALPGDYAITVSKVEIRELPEGLTPEEAQAAFAELGPPKNLLPNAYRSPNTSGLKVTVGDAPPEPLTLELEG